MSNPSNGLAFWGSTPTAEVSVWNQSCALNCCSSLLPAVRTPFHRTTPGTRMPPSNALLLPPRSGSLLAPARMLPPLSLTQTTSVSSAMPSASNAASTFPTPSSMALTIAANTFRLESSRSG